MVELLAPAAPTSLRAAVNAGADAVYISEEAGLAHVPMRTIRMRMRCWTEWILSLAWEKAVYDGQYTSKKEEKLEQELYSYLFSYYQAGLDGVIVQDFGVVQYLAEHFPGFRCMRARKDDYRL